MGCNLMPEPISQSSAPARGESSKEPAKKRKPRGKGSKAMENADDTSAARQLNDNDFNMILKWIEIPWNLAKIQGSAKNPGVGSKPIPKMQAFWELTAWFNALTMNRGKEPILPESMKDRFMYFKKKYKAVHEESHKTGWGCDETDGDELPDLDALRTKHFKYYHRMEALFGGTPSVQGRKQRKTTAHGIGSGATNKQTTENEKDLNDSNGDDISDEDKSSLQTEGPGEGETDFYDLGGGGSEAGFGVDGVNTLVDEESWIVALNGEQPHPAQNPPQAPTGGPVHGATLNNPHQSSVPQPLVTEGQPPQQQKTRRRSASQPPRKSNSDMGEGSEVGDDCLDDLPDIDDKPAYPSKKKINETRHSINESFSLSLAELNAVRERANEISSERFGKDAALKREQFEEAKRVQKLKEEEVQLCREVEDKDRKWQRTNAKLEREERKAERMHRKTANTQSFIANLMQFGGGTMKPEDMEKFLDLAKN